MFPPAPGLFSITTGWPRRSPSLLATARAERSVDPAGGKGTIIFSGFEGKAWANAVAAIAMSDAPRKMRRASVMISSSGRAPAGDPDSGQHDSTPGELRGPDRLPEEQPREDRCHHRLDQQAHRGERRGQVRESVGDEALAEDLGHQREADDHEPPMARR